VSTESVYEPGADPDIQQRATGVVESVELARNTTGASHSAPPAVD
jgi:hypothetical protein